MDIQVITDIVGLIATIFVTVFYLSPLVFVPISVFHASSAFVVQFLLSFIFPLTWKLLRVCISLIFAISCLEADVILQVRQGFFLFFVLLNIFIGV